MTRGRRRKPYLAFWLVSEGGTMKRGLVQLLFVGSLIYCVMVSGVAEAQRLSGGRADARPA